MNRTTTDSSVGMERAEGARNALKTPPHEAVERLEELARRCNEGDPWYSDDDLRSQSYSDLLPQDRRFIAAANPQAILQLIAREAVMREDAEADRAFHLEALGQIKAAIEYGDNPAMLIETAIRMASIAEVRERNAARTALTHSPETDGEG